jgi:RHS repeat-associated protein
MKKYYYAGTTRIGVRTGSGTGTSGLVWLFGDHLGSTSRSANYDGASTALQLYKAWGESRYASGTLPTGFKFTGQRLESSLGIYDYGARWYDAYLNRWLQPDGIIPEPNNPLDWDRYQYVRSNPVRYTDPTGHKADPGGAEIWTTKMTIYYAQATLLERVRKSFRESYPGKSGNIYDEILQHDNPIARSLIFNWALNEVGHASITGGFGLELALVDLALISGSNLSTGLIGLAMGGDVSSIPGGGSLGSAGAYGNLVKMTESGEVVHHMPQKALGFTGKNEGGALIVTQAEHVQTRTYGYRGAITAREESGLSFRQVLARDIWDIKSLAGSKYNSGLWELIDYYYQFFQDLIQK